MKSYLVALRPPGNIAAEIARLQEALFAEAGIASALALPPLVPLASLVHPPDRGMLEDRSSGRLPPLRPGPPELLAGCLMLPLYPAEPEPSGAALLGELRRGLIEADRVRQPAADLPLSPLNTEARLAFYLAAKMAATEDAAPPQTVKALPGFTLRVANLSILELHYETGERWWEELVWIERWRSRSLRSSRPKGEDRQAR